MSDCKTIKWFIGGTEDRTSIAKGEHGFDVVLSKDEAAKLLAALQHHIGLDSSKDSDYAQFYVDREGRTRLPEVMLRDLKVGEGGHFWFIKGPEYWEVWPEADLQRMLGGDELEGATPDEEPETRR